MPNNIERSNEQNIIMKKTALIIDDSLYIRALIRDTLEEAGFEVLADVETGEAGIEEALEHNPDVITIDNILPDMLGLDIIKTLKENDIPSTLIMISAVGQQSVVSEGIKLGASDYITKPFTAEQLVEAVNKALDAKES